MALETAIVMVVFLVLILSFLVLGLGSFRRQELSFLAREGARWASVHGLQYARDTKSSPATTDDVYNRAILPKLVLLDPDSLSYQVSWNNSNAPYHTVINANKDLVKITNTVTVTLRYQWIPEAFFGGLTLSSTSVLPMSN